MSAVILDAFADCATQQFRVERPMLTAARMRWARQRLAADRAAAMGVMLVYGGIPVRAPVEVEIRPGVTRTGVVMDWRNEPYQGRVQAVASVRLDPVPVGAPGWAAPATVLRSYSELKLRKDI